MERFKIFPSIGIARVGGSKDGFYLCSEKNGSLGLEIDAAGKESELAKFKDDHGLIKRQASRFRVYEFDAAANQYNPADMNSLKVEWKVKLVNKKAAAVRPQVPPIGAPKVPLPLKTGFEDLIIDGQEKSIKGNNQTGIAFDAGKYNGHPVFLGELKTDSSGNLMVLGGRGISHSVSNPPTKIKGYYYTDTWFDDVSDSYVRATVTLPDGSTIDALSAWVIVAPPDFAPGVKGLVTLYDVMEDVAVTDHKLTEIAQPSFSKHIQPILDRFRQLQWVHGGNDDDSIFISLTDTNEVLSDNSAANAQKRKTARSTVKSIEDILHSRDQPTLIGFQLTSLQGRLLTKWVTGDFINDFANPPAETLSPADLLNKYILDSTVGQGFYPGIEGGVIVTEPSIYFEPFRFDDKKLTSGDVTGLMALPWQADFADCVHEWWPSQRPDDVMQDDGTFKSWDEGIGDGNDMVVQFNLLGFVVPVTAAGTTKQIEKERSLPR